MEEKKTNLLCAISFCWVVEQMIHMWLLCPIYNLSKSKSHGFNFTALFCNFLNTQSSLPVVQAIGIHLPFTPHPIPYPSTPGLKNEMSPRLRQAMWLVLQQAP